MWVRSAKSSLFVIMAAVIGWLTIVKLVEPDAALTDAFRSLWSRSSLRFPGAVTLTDCIGTYERKKGENSEGIHLGTNGRFWKYHASSESIGLNENGHYRLELGRIHVKLDAISFFDPDAPTAFWLSPVVDGGNVIGMSPDSGGERYLLRTTKLPMSSSLADFRRYVRSGPKEPVLSTSGRASQRMSRYRNYALSLLEERQTCNKDVLGWATCPGCRGYFNTESALAFEFGIHVTCGAALTILNPGSRR